MEEATEVREELNRLEDLDAAEQIDGFPYVIEQHMLNILEGGTMTPDSQITFTKELDLSERISGEAEIKMTGILSMGIMLGTALERDIPAGSELETKFRQREFTLPEKDNNDHKD
jgi:hypothetical protein